MYFRNGRSDIPQDPTQTKFFTLLCLEIKLKKVTTLGASGLDCLKFLLDKTTNHRNLCINWCCLSFGNVKGNYTKRERKKLFFEVQSLPISLMSRTVCTSKNLPPEILISHGGESYRLAWYLADAWSPNPKCIRPSTLTRQSTQMPNSSIEW